ncbi:MAG TPA: hypothetical protein PKO22_09190 [Treponemataceae bacterium]|nr:hypothetical protein [Treponemataceae bacterium]
MTSRKNPQSRFGTLAFAYIAISLTGCAQPTSDTVAPVVDAKGTLLKGAYASYFPIGAAFAPTAELSSNDYSVVNAEKRAYRQNDQ